MKKWLISILLPILLFITFSAQSQVEFFGLRKDSITPFSPSDLANLAAWYKPDAGVTTSGGTITSWADQSGNSRTLTTFGAAPTWSTSGLNGYGIVTGNGSSMTGLTYDGSLREVLMHDSANGGITKKMKALTVELTSPADGDFIVYQTSGDKAVNITLALPQIRATGAIAGYTGNATVVTYTTPNSVFHGTYTISPTLNITEISADVIEVRITWTDSYNNSRTKSFFGQGLTAAGLSATGASSFAPMVITCYPNTAITVTTVLTTGVGSITYTAFASIQWNFDANPF